MNEVTYTPGPWNVACDSYGRVRHSKKACVYVVLRDTKGVETITKVAAQIPSWSDARLIAATPRMYEVLMQIANNADVPQAMRDLAEAAIADARQS